MKTIKLSLLAILFIFFSSCSKDDEPDLNSSMMLGEWNLSSLNYEGKTELNYEGTNYTTTYSGVAENIDFTLTFNADNTFESKGSYDINLILEGFSQILPIEDFTSSGDWSIDGNVLKTTTLLADMSNSEFVPADSVGEIIIQEMTENRVVLIIDQVSIFEVSGFENTATLSGEYVLTR